MLAGWNDDPETWPPKTDRRRIHWQIEQQLREELLASTPDDREDVTRDVYNRLFEQVPWHDANVADAETVAAYEDHWFRLYGPLTRPTDVLVDIGCGRGSLVKRFAPAVKECIGLDASDAMIELAGGSTPDNVRFVVGSLRTPPLPAGSADFVVSRQLLEHLHPDDMPDHLRAVFDMMRPGGRFLVETPSRLTGPWDISRGFTSSATGFHLREYTNGEMGELLHAAGFRRVRGPAVPARLLVRLGTVNRHFYLPVAAKRAIERLLRGLPSSLRPKVAGALLVRDVTLVAERT